MFRKDWDKCGEGMLFYVNENIPTKEVLLNSTPNDNEVILLEFSIKVSSGFLLVSLKQHLKFNSLSRNMGELNYHFMIKLCSLEVLA